MPVTFQLDGHDFFALNGGPQFTFTPAISFFVNCETQQEVDHLWEKLCRRDDLKMRLAAGQVRPFMANHSLDFGEIAAPERFRKIGKSDEGYAANG